MFYDISFKKSNLIMYHRYREQKLNVQSFIDLIDVTFNISKSTFYNWLNNDDIIVFKQN
jgi:hypothetical protein